MRRSAILLLAFAPTVALVGCTAYGPTRIAPPPTSVAPPAYYQPGGAPQPTPATHGSLQPTPTPVVVSPTPVAAGQVAPASHVGPAAPAAVAPAGGVAASPHGNHVIRVIEPTVQSNSGGTTNLPGGMPINDATVQAQPPRLIVPPPATLPGPAARSYAAPNSAATRVRGLATTQPAVAPAAAHAALPSAAQNGTPAAPATQPTATASSGSASQLKWKARSPKSS